MAGNIAGGPPRTVEVDVVRRSRVVTTDAAVFLSIVVRFRRKDSDGTGAALILSVVVRLRRRDSDGRVGRGLGMDRGGIGNVLLRSGLLCWREAGVGEGS